MIEKLFLNICSRLYVEFKIRIYLLFRGVVFKKYFQKYLGQVLIAAVADRPSHHFSPKIRAFYLVNEYRCGRFFNDKFNTEHKQSFLNFFAFVFQNPSDEYG